MANPIQITARLFESRETARVLLGKEWPSRAKEYGGIIQSYARRNGLSDLQAALVIAEDLVSNGMTPLFLLAAAVELINPRISTSPAEAIRTNEMRPPSASEELGAEHRSLRESSTAAPGPGAPALGPMPETREPGSGEALCSSCEHELWCPSAYAPGCIPQS